MLVYAFYPLVETNGNEEMKAKNALIHCLPIYGTDKLRVREALAKSELC
jgi:hypothetical protein